MCCNITWPTAPRVCAWSAAMNSVTADSVDSFSKVNHQERGIFEGSDELSDNCFSDNDVEWNSEEDDVISCGENDNLWEEFHLLVSTMQHQTILYIHRLVIMWRMKFH